MRVDSRLLLFKLLWGSDLKTRIDDCGRPAIENATALYSTGTSNYYTKNEGKRLWNILSLLK